jgi:hypothetical protein
MNRFFTLIVAGVIFIAVSSFFFQNGVTIKVDMPDVIEAGTEITVTVTINKGKVSGFAGFRQDLPFGFTARAVNSANADFSFQDQKVRLVWLRVPDDDEITFSYKIIAHERISGKIDLEGRFSYIENNKYQSVDLQPRLLAIHPSPNVSPDMIVDVRDYAKFASIEAAASKAGGNAIVLRQQPVWLEDEKIFLVTLLVNKDVIQKFAKIEEATPKGYTAASIDSKSGIFTFKDQMAKIIWMDLPAEPYFTVTYKLIPEEGVAVNSSAPMFIAGEFSYMVNDITYSSTIIQRTETLTGLSKEQVNSLVRKATTEKPVLVSGTTTSQRPGSSSTTTVSSKNTPASSTGRPLTSGGDANDMLKPESGVYYRVQIAAGHKPVNAQRYFRGHKLQYSVMKEIHEGWYKYSVGSFAVYKDARDYRVNLSNNSTLKDAFVAAYNNGNRITVQDALMALNQPWYK